MSVTSNDLLKSAIILIKRNHEIDYRNAASRAYYCAFHEAESIVKKFPKIHVPVQKTGVHKKIIDALQKHPNSLYQQIGALLKQCKIIRTQADYYLYVNFAINSAQDAVDMTMQILSLLYPSRPHTLISSKNSL